MSSNQSISCKLPLLDGDAKASPRVIAVDSVSADVGKLQKLYKNDKPTFDAHVCAAWALLLRCYTGQDDVCFRFQHNASDADPPLLHLDFQEDEPLSTIVERATAPDLKTAGNKRTNNTTVVIGEGNFQVSEVSQSQSG